MLRALAGREVGNEEESGELVGLVSLFRADPPVLCVCVRVFVLSL